MKRDLVALSKSRYDILVIGGGINGACIAREAALRGLSVALVEKGDFASATSANSLKIIHGGLRYLQHADVKRMRVSIRERWNLMRTAPHLIHPLPVLVPTYGHGRRGKEVFRLAMLLNDAMGFDRNRHLEPQKQLPRGRVVSKQECLQRLPGLEPDGLTGAALFYDAQVHNSERFLLACLHSAAQAGAALANYVEVTGFLTKQRTVSGAVVRDRLTGEQFDIRAKVVVNACGPWIDQVLGLLRDAPPRTGVRFAKAVNIISRLLFPSYAVGLPSAHSYRDSDTVLDKGHRLLFVTPWRGHALIGTAYTVSNGDPADGAISLDEVRAFLVEINRAYPPARLCLEEVLYGHAGLVPISGTHPITGDVQLAKHELLFDHRQDGWQGLISVVGVKYTTARYVAEKVMNHLFQRWDKRAPRSLSAIMPLHGGQMERLDMFTQEVMRQAPCGLGEDSLRRLISNYGSAYQDVLRYLDPCHNCEERHRILAAETLYGIHEEMAQTLADVVFRRTELGTLGYPGRVALHGCAEVMGGALGWDKAKIGQEIADVEARFPIHFVQEGSRGSALARTAIQ